MTPEYLEQLADIADPDKLWRLAGLDRLSLPKDKRQQLDMGVALRRYADHERRLLSIMALQRSLLITPLSENSTASMVVKTPHRYVRLREQGLRGRN